MACKQFFMYLLVTFQVTSISVFAELIKTNNVKLEQKLESSETLTSLLAEDICWDLESYRDKLPPVAFDECVKNFLESRGIKKDVPPTVQLKCLQQSSIKYSTEAVATRAKILVVLTSDNVTLLNLPFNIMDNDTELGTIYITPGRYRVWSAFLNLDGTHSLWRRGPDFLSWNSTGEIHQKNYTIEVKMTGDIVNGISKINANFSWNYFDNEDACFQFVNYCNDRLRDISISPNMNRSVQITQLPLDTACEARLIGKYGMTRFTYRTLTCSQLPQCIDVEMVHNLTLEAEKGDRGWTVVASWTRPHVDPLQYNVTLFAEHFVSSVIVPGNETWATFTDVADNGLYDVAVGAVRNSWTAYTSARAMFPEAHEVRALGSALGAWWALPALGAAAAATVGLVWRRRRASRLSHIYFPEPDDKLPKDGISEIVDLESTAAEDHWELRSERLLLHEVIGEGAFGVVRRGTLAPASKEVAIKMLKDFPTLEEIRSFRAEMELMKSVGAHPHIVSLVGCCSGRRPMIVAEYCSRGDLLSYLRCSWDVMVSKRNAKYYNNNIESSDYRNDLFKCKLQGHSKLVVNKLYDLQGVCDTDLTTRDLLSFCRQIAMGMEFLASNRLVHRDLAARNVLVASDRTLKIADFGLSRDVYEENQYKQKGNGKMPMKWMALESLTHRIYTTQSDVWSFGVVMWEVCSVGASPYAGVEGARLPRLLRAGYRMPRPAHCPPPLYEVMMSCWRAHPRERPTFSELHARLDELLNCACGGDYLRLDLDERPTISTHKYVRMIIKSKLGWSRGESYERPLRAVQSNHYSSPPASLARTPIL